MTEKSTFPGKQSLILEQVRIALDERELINISAEIPAGEVLSIMGPSGSGKSTLLAYIAGFLDPVFSASGTVLLGDRALNPLPAEDRQVGVLFQDPLLFPHMSVGHNLMFAIRPEIGSRPNRLAFANKALADADMDGHFDRDPATLSGGQKARIALMRVLCSKPKALLLDEPFSRLDTRLRDQIRSFVFGTAKEHGLPVLLVTHDESDAKAAGGRIIELAQ